MFKVKKVENGKWKVESCIKNKKIFSFQLSTFNFPKIIAILCMICIIACGCANKHEQNEDTLTKIIKRDKLIVGVRHDAPPFGYMDKDGQLKGYDVDLAKIFAQSLLGDENKLELIPVTASNRIMVLNSGEADILVAMMSMTERRKAILDFSTPYYIAGQAILVNKSTKATQLRDFKGKKLIIVFGSTSENDLRANAPGIDIIGFKTYKEAFKALKDGRAEGIVADDTILLRYALQDSSVKLLPKRYSKEPYAVVFRQEPESKKLIDKIDYIVEYLQQTGRLKKMQEKWGID